MRKLKMKILLINPPFPKQMSYGFFSFASPNLVSLGLCSLAAYIQKEDKDMKVKVIDCVFQNISFENLIREINEFKADIIGISSTTCAYNISKKLVSCIRENNSKVIIVLGGPHISALPFDTFKECENLDFGVVGEGEISFGEIIKWMKGGKKKDEIEGVIFKEGGKIRLSKQRSVIENLDTLPFPSLDFLNLAKSKHTPIRSKGTSLHLVTSRGCPFRCNHCEQAVFGSVYRSKSVDYIIREIKVLKEQCSIRSIAFEDDSFVINMKKMRDFCYGLIKEKIDVEWSCSIRNELIDKDVLPIMRKAGCNYLYFGIESGSQRMLKILNKDTPLEKIEHNVKLTKKEGLKAHGSFVIGLPTENRESIKQTVDFAIKLKLDSVTFNLFTPFPKTALREMAFKHGKVSKNWDFYSDHPTYPSFIPEGFNASEMLNIQKDAYRKFYLRSGYILSHLYYLNPSLILKSAYAFGKLAKK